MSEFRNYEIGEREKETLRALRVFRGLSEEGFKAALERGMAHGVRFKKDAVIAEAESRIDEFMVILSGRVQGVREHENGAQDFVQLYTSAEIFGLDIVCSATRKCPFRLQTLDDTDVVFINYYNMISGKVDGVFARKLHEGVTQTLANESLKRLHKIDVLYRKALRDRISVYLKNLVNLTGSAHVEIYMDREQFAQYLGVNRSSLSHELAQMRDEGLINFHKGTFEVLGEL